MNQERIPKSSRSRERNHSSKKRVTIKDSFNSSPLSEQDGMALLENLKSKTSFLFESNEEVIKANSTLQIENSTLKSQLSRIMKDFEKEKSALRESLERQFSQAVVEETKKQLSEKETSIRTFYSRKLEEIVSESNKKHEEKQTKRQMIYEREINEAQRQLDCLSNENKQLVNEIKALKEQAFCQMKKGSVDQDKLEKELSNLRLLIEKLEKEKSSLVHENLVQKGENEKLKARNEKLKMQAAEVVSSQNELRKKLKEKEESFREEARLKAEGYNLIKKEIKEMRACAHQLELVKGERNAALEHNKALSSQLEKAEEAGFKLKEKSEELAKLRGQMRFIMEERDSQVKLIEELEGKLEEAQEKSMALLNDQKEQETLETKCQMRVKVVANGKN